MGSNGEKIKTLEGENVTVAITKTSNSTTVKINDAMVTTANVKASNGVVHIIDKVLIPPSFTAPTIPELAAAANLSSQARSYPFGCRSFYRLRANQCRFHSIASGCSHSAFEAREYQKPHNSLDLPCRLW